MIRNKVIWIVLLLFGACSSDMKMTNEDFIARAKRSLENTIVDLEKDQRFSQTTHKKILTNYPKGSDNLYLAFLGDGLSTSIQVRIGIGGPFVHTSLPGDIVTVWNTQIERTEIVTYSGFLLTQATMPSSKPLKPGQMSHNERHQQICAYLKSNLMEQGINIK